MRKGWGWGWGWVACWLVTGRVAGEDIGVGGVCLWKLKWRQNRVIVSKA